MILTIQDEASVYSQNGEDGIIQKIFDVVGTTNKIAAEIGTSTLGYPNPIETNTMNLLSSGWKTFWFDSNDPSYVPQNCVFTKEFLTTDNIADIFAKAGVPKDLDLLSIDVDGNDYHFREALYEFNPRVCVMEYNGCFDGSTEHIMPLNNDYVWAGNNDRIFGASLKSYTMQADRMGYDLVYCDSQGVNAFYVRKDINVFTALTSERAWVKLWWS
jgi:hypothetical protein